MKNVYFEGHDNFSFSYTKFNVMMIRNTPNPGAIVCIFRSHTFTPGHSPLDNNNPDNNPPEITTRTITLPPNYFMIDAIFIKVRKNAVRNIFKQKIKHFCKSFHIKNKNLNGILDPELSM